MANMYDIVIIGGGPGGYSDALYAARAGLHVAVIEKRAIGGQAIRSENIENYPGFDAGIDGLRLSEKMQRGAERFGAEMVTDEVRRVHLMQPVKVIEAAKQTYQAPTVILATGAPPRKLGVEGEEEMLGRGVHYYAACRSMMYRRKTVAVIGEGEQAAEAAMLLSRIAKRVCLVHRGDHMEISPAYAGKLKMMRNIERYAGSEVRAFLHANSGAVNSGTCHATALLSASAVYRKRACSKDRLPLMSGGIFLQMRRLQPISQAFSRLVMFGQSCSGAF